MRRELPGGYELDDAAARIDVDAVHRYLSEDAYWAAGRPREIVEELIGSSARVVGLYHAGEQVGFARVVSDRHVVAYLADVYVLPGHRGLGLGHELPREAVEARSSPSAGTSTPRTDMACTSGSVSARRLPR
jgi:GNAT superfamily N-acetyltransferase